MFNQISEKNLLALRAEYIPGTRVELLKMDDPYTHIPIGEKGTVDSVDDIGSIHITWDCGSSLAVVYGEDSCRKIDLGTTHRSDCYEK